MANDKTTTANTTDAADNATENAVKKEYKKIKALVVKSVASSFRRIGLAFTKEATHLDPSLLTKDQVATLKADPNLVVTEASVLVADSGTKATTPVVTPVSTASE